MTHNQYDVLIIGGGFAGLTAARELSGQGLKIGLLEAKDRLGGRAWTQEWDGQLQELGGGWVSWAQPHVWAEITRYGLDLFERPGWPKDFDAPLYALVDGEVVAQPMAENMGQIVPLLAEYGAAAAEVFPRPYDPHSSMDRIAAYDHLSNEDRLNQMALSPLQRVLMERFLALQPHNHPSVGGYVEFLRWYALAHHKLDVYLSATTRYQFTDGTQALVQAMVGDIDGEIHLNSPVARVNQDDTQVTVTLEAGEKMTAKQVIFAVPINVLDSIAVTPALNDAKQSLSRERHAGVGKKIFAKIAGHWPQLNCAADANAPITTVVVQEATNDETLLVLFTVNDRLEATVDGIQTALRQFVPEIEVRDFIYHDWVADPYALGTWCGYRPGQTSKYLRDAQAAEGRLHFAGSDLANGWRGFFDGAIESGLRVAREVKQAVASG